jgi:hypothetical protein
MYLRIGPKRHNYKYSLWCEGVYFCCRGSDEAVNLGTNERLVLLQTANARWTAFDVAMDKTPLEAETVGIPVFDTDENAVEAGWHTWRSNYNRSQSSPDWRSTGLLCETTLL